MANSRHWQYVWGQLLTSNTHNIFQLQEQNDRKCCNPHDSYLPTWENIALPHTSPNLMQKSLK